MHFRIAMTALLLVGGVARADDDTAVARQHFEAGSKLYDLGRFREAAAEYEEAYKAKSDPVLLFNIGQAYRAAGANAEALNAYRAYLRRVPAAPNRADVEAHIARLQQLIASTPTTTTPPPATTTPPPATTTPPPATTTPPPAERTPLYKKWWLWTAVGGVLVVGGVIALSVAYTTPKDAPAPPGAATVTF